MLGLGFNLDHPRPEVDLADAVARRARKKTRAAIDAALEMANWAGDDLVSTTPADAFTRALTT